MQIQRIMVLLVWNIGQTWRWRSRGQTYCTFGNVLLQVMHMWNMKALPLTVQKLLSRLKFSKCRSKLTVKVKYVGTDERSCHKEYTCEIWMSYLLRIQRYDQCYLFSKCRSKVTVKVMRSKILVLTERSCHKEYTMWNMKALSHLVQKLWPRWKFLWQIDEWDLMSPSFR